MVLYGMFEAKKTIAKEDLCYLVEGYTDVIQLHQKGIMNVVSSSGTALTIDQITLIRRLTSNVTMLFDGDKAGVNATLRGIDIVLTAGLNVNICSFPNGEDPDSYSQDKSFEEIDVRKLAGYQVPRPGGSSKNGRSRTDRPGGRRRLTGGKSP